MQLLARITSSSINFWAHKKKKFLRSRFTGCNIQSIIPFANDEDDDDHNVNNDFNDDDISYITTNYIGIGVFFFV